MCLKGKTSISHKGVRDLKLATTPCLSSGTQIKSSSKIIAGKLARCTTNDKGPDRWAKPRNVWISEKEQLAHLADLNSGVLDTDRLSDETLSFHPTDKRKA